MTTLLSVRRVLPILAAAGAALATLSVAHNAHADACGLTFLPTEVGTVWKYDPLPSSLPPDPAYAKLTPAQPKAVTVKVTAVDTAPDAKGAPVTKVSLLEIVDAREVKTTLECTATGISASPNSLFFSGEPGGVYGLELSDVVRPGMTWKLAGKGTLATGTWNDDFKATYKRPAPRAGSEMGSGTFEFVRVWRNEGNEQVFIGTQTFTANKVAVVTTGKVNAKGATKPYESRELVSTFWFAPGVGLVKLQNAYGHAYVLNTAAPAAPGAPVAPAAPAAPAPPAAK